MLQRIRLTPTICYLQSRCCQFALCRRRAPLATAAFLVASASSSSNITTTSALLAAAYSTIRMPQLPLKYDDLVSSTKVELNLSDLSQRIAEAENRRQRAYDLSRHMNVELVRAQNNVGHDDAMTSLRTFVRTSEGSDDDNNDNNNNNNNNDDDDSSLLHPPSTDENRTPRLANLSSRVEDLVRLEAYHYFLQTGQLIPLSTLHECYNDIYITDEEYLAGACMGLAQDLQRYGLGRATVRDVDSVQAAASLMSDIQGFLLQMDFRNNYLRRKFDGTKYALKALETLLYELAVTAGAVESKQEEEPDSKRVKPNCLVPDQELQQLKERMDHRDQLRESLIKQCRDSQKAAKQAIFALHRGDTKRTQQLLQQCQLNIKDHLLPLVQQDLPLRSSGSFSGVLEEYVEARLYAAWLHGPDFATDGSKDSAVGVLLKPEDFSELELEPEEYLGGLCDLTGEVGRYAVQKGTARDVATVRLCLQTNTAVHTALQSLERFPAGVGKKVDMVRRSVEKIERMLYELSLSEAAGGRKVQSDVEMEEQTDTGA